jgi:hypothetical protein
MNIHVCTYSSSIFCTWLLVQYANVIEKEREKEPESESKNGEGVGESLSERERKTGEQEGGAIKRGMQVRKRASEREERAREGEQARKR